MKKLLGTILLALILFNAFSQNSRFTVSGTVTDKNTGLPIASAPVSFNGLQSLTDDAGHFRFTRVVPGSYKLSVSSLGYVSFTQPALAVHGDINVPVALGPTAVFLQPLEVRALRASDRAPFAKTNIGRDQIEKSNLGQDIPFLLEQTPSVVINSDAGNGVGYTAIRIRGSDATRINVTLNGIPYNDAESMGTYFVDLPDFASSVGSIQVQRGVGTSSNGAGAFGGTINLSSNEFNEKAYGELNNSFGSFNTWKNTVRAGTGLIGGHFTVDARLSSITSNGYIDRATSDLKSFYFSTSWLNTNSSLRLNIFSGKERTYQAWYGVPGNLLATDRTYNPAGTEKPGTPYDNQTDNYTQTHYQLFFNHAFTGKWTFNTAVFLTRGKGYYEEYKASQSYSDYSLPNPVIAGVPVLKSDLVRRRWLDNYFYGQIASVQYKNGGDELAIGGGWTVYDGKHYGTLPWLQTGTVSPDFRYYDYPAKKTDVNVYAKWQHRLNLQWSTFADFQYRTVRHDMNGFEGNPSLHVNRSFGFFNPKAGITYAAGDWQVFASYALAHKEPNRDDFQAGAASQPKPETLHDAEFGIEKRTANFHASATVYYMYYVNQLVLTGQINDVGSYTRTNVPYSYRAGIELQAGGVLNPFINISGNLAFSRNKISSYTEYIDNYDNGGQDAVPHRNTDISFSPAITGAATINILPVKNVELSLLSKYVGKEYMDNSQNDARKLDAFFTENARASWTLRNRIFSEWKFTVQVNNIFNAKYEPNGYTYPYVSGGALVTENGYYPMAGANFMVGVNVKL